MKAEHYPKRKKNIGLSTFFIEKPSKSSGKCGVQLSVAEHVFFSKL